MRNSPEGGSPSITTTVVNIQQVNIQVCGSNFHLCGSSRILLLCCYLANSGNKREADKRNCSCQHLLALCTVHSKEENSFLPWWCWILVITKWRSGEQAFTLLGVCQHSAKGVWLCPSSGACPVSFSVRALHYTQVESSSRPLPLTSPDDSGCCRCILLCTGNTHSKCIETHTHKSNQWVRNRS